MIRMTTLALAAAWLLSLGACADVDAETADGTGPSGPVGPGGPGGPGGEVLDPEDVEGPGGLTENPWDVEGPLDVPWEEGGPPEIVASRTSGVAPLLVVFEGDLHPGIPAASPFHELDYVWDFGDPDSGQWPTNGAFRGMDYGPVGAHVFEEPGTYTVRLAVRDADGSLATGEVEIVVDDPDTVFAGSDTVCFSGAGNFDGCPAGASHVTSRSMGQVDSRIGAGKRLLLRRGETFTGSVNISSSGPGILGAFGSGDSPVLAVSGATKGVMLTGNGRRTRDWRIMDLEVDGNGGRGIVGFEAGGTMTDVLMLRVTVHDAASAFSFSTAVLEYNGMPDHDVVGVVDSRGYDFNGGGGDRGGFISGQRLAILGTEIDLGTQGEHVVRAGLMRASVMSHNILANPARTKAVLKLHAPTWEGQDSDYTERVVLRRNAFIGARENNWLINPGAQNRENEERVRDLIFDGNFFVAGPGTQVALAIHCPQVTVRNNVFDMSEGLAHKCVTIGRTLRPDPEDITVVHNTCYSATEDARLVEGASSWPNVAVLNNLVVSPDATVGASSGGSVLVEGNQVSRSTDVFVADNPMLLEDFALDPASGAIDGGASIPLPTRDIRGRLRELADLAPDVGAFDLD